MPLYAVLVRENFGGDHGHRVRRGRHDPTLGMALGPGRRPLYDTFGDYFWLYIGSFGIGLGGGRDGAEPFPPAARRRRSPRSTSGARQPEIKRAALRCSGCAMTSRVHPARP